jgi:uncharacterized protein Yka (UPF0111/DUF47 family)
MEKRKDYQETVTLLAQKDELYEKIRRIDDILDALRSPGALLALDRAHSRDMKAHKRASLIMSIDRALEAHEEK